MTEQERDPSLGRRQARRNRAGPHRPSPLAPNAQEVAKFWRSCCRAAAYFEAARAGWLGLPPARDLKMIQAAEVLLGPQLRAITGLL